MSNVLTGSYGLRALDDAGDPIAGAKLYVYEAGGSTPLASYSNEARTNANSQPVVADGDGWFGSVYIADDTLAKFVLKDASDVTLQTWDNVNAVLLTSSTTVAALGISIINPITYGAVGDGVANEVADVQAAIDAANAAGGGTVYLLGKTYRCDTQLTMYSDVRILGPGTLDFSACTDNEYIKCQGATGTAYALSANASYGAASFTATPSGFSAGDMVLIKSGQVVANSVTSGEVNELASSSTLTHTLSDDYNTADTATISEITPLENVVLEDFDILADSSVADTIVLVDRCRNLTLRDVRITGGDVYAVKITASIGTRVEKCKFVDMSNAEAVTVLGGSRNTTIDSCAFRSCGTPIYLSDSVSSNGHVIGLYVLDCDFSRSGNDHIRIERHAFDVAVDGCRFSGGSTYSAVFMTNDGVFSNNVGNEAFGILLADGFVSRSERPWDIIVKDNRSRNTTMSIESADAAFTGNGGLLRMVEISGNKGFSELSISVVWDGATRLQCEQLLIANNHCDDGTIVVTVSGAASIVTNLRVLDNVLGTITISDGGTGLLRDTAVERNAAHGDFDTLISVTSDNDVWCRDNIVSGDNTASNIGIKIAGSGSSLLHITGNSVQTIGGTGIKVEAPSLVFSTVITNNDIQVTPGPSGEHAIHITGSHSRVVIANNDCRVVNDNDSNIHLEATSSGDITNVTIANNVFSNGAYGVEFTNGDGNSWASGNVFTGILTDEYLGAVGRRVLGIAYADSSTAAANSTSLGSITIAGNLLRAGDVVCVKASVYGENNSAGTVSAQVTINIPSLTNCIVADDILAGDNVAVVAESNYRVVDDAETANGFISFLGNDTAAGTAGTASQSDFTQNAVVATDDAPAGSFDRTSDITVQVLGTFNDALAIMQLAYMTVELLREGT